MKSIAFILLITLFAGRISAQTSNLIVSGVVVDETGLELIGATVLIKATGQGTVTDYNGRFSLDIPEEEVQLVISYIGYIKQELTVKVGSEIRIVMSADVESLSEVIVIGYGSIRKSDITSAISTVETEDIKSIPQQGAVGILQGRAAGVRVVSPSGQPGSQGTVLVRGINSVNSAVQPIYVVDGLIVNDISFLSNSDIESISVLKDAAAAAVYGARGSAGVVEITTKRGKMTAKKYNNVRFSTFWGLSQPWKDPNLPNATDYFRMLHTRELNDNVSENDFVYDDLDSLLDYVEQSTGQREGINWWEESLEESPIIQNYEVSLTGGLKSFAYHGGVKYFNQKGIINQSDYDRWNVNLNTDWKPIKKLTITTNFIYSHEQQRALRIPVAAQTADREAGINPNSGGGIFGNILTATPTTPIFRDPNNPLHAPYLEGYDPGIFPSKFHAPWPVGEGPSSPLYQLARDKDNIRNIARLIYGIKVRYDITDKLYFTSYVASDNRVFERDDFLNMHEISPNIRANESTYTQYNKQSRFVSWDNLLNYADNYGKHAVSVLLGSVSIQFIESDTTLIWARPEPVYGDFKDMSIYDTVRTPPNIRIKETQQSFLARINYSYDNRYLFQFSHRWDGSSKFTPENRWGNFTSLSLGWAFTNEKFFKSNKFISYGKLYFGYGEIGNQQIPNGVTETQYGISDELRYLVGVDRELRQGWTNLTFANSRLRWETVVQNNFGLELGLLDDRLNLVAEYYTKKNQDLLLRVPVPDYTGLQNDATPWANVGVMTNNGVDVQLTYRGSLSKLNYEITSTFDHYENRLTNTSFERVRLASFDSKDLTWLEAGKPVGYFRGYVSDGIFQDSVDLANHPMSLNSNTRVGHLKYRDINGDSVLNDEDWVMIGDPNPDFSYGLSLNLSYGKWSLGLQFAGVYGNDIYDFQAQKSYLNGIAGDINEISFRSPGTISANDPGNMTNKMFVITRNQGENGQINSHFIKDGSYLRFKNLLLAYTFKGLINGTIKDLRLYASVSNLFTWTKFDGLDPEIGSQYGYFMGVNLYNYPQPRMYTVGLEMNL